MFIYMLYSFAILPAIFKRFFFFNSKVLYYPKKPLVYDEAE